MIRFLSLLTKGNSNKTYKLLECCLHCFAYCMHSCSLTPVVSKASSGVLELMPIHSINNTTEFCKILKESNWDVVGTGSKADETNGRTYTPVGSFNLSHPTVIILGKFDLMSSNCRANNDVSFFFRLRKRRTRVTG